jgi:hypothetical protein
LAYFTYTALERPAAGGKVTVHANALHTPGALPRVVEIPAITSDGIPMAWIDWNAVVAALDSGHLPASGGEMRIVCAQVGLGHLPDLVDSRLFTIMFV